MKDLDVKFDLNDLSWKVTEVDKDPVTILDKAYFTIRQNPESRSYSNVKFGLSILADNKVVQTESFDQDVDTSVPTMLEIKRDIPLLLKPESVNDVTFWLEVNNERYTYSYIISTVTPIEPNLGPDYVLN